MPPMVLKLLRTKVKIDFKQSIYNTHTGSLFDELH